MNEVVATFESVGVGGVLTYLQNGAQEEWQEKLSQIYRAVIPAFAVEEFERFNNNPTKQRRQDNFDDYWDFDEDEEPEEEIEEPEGLNLGAIGIGAFIAVQSIRKARQILSTTTDEVTNTVSQGMEEGLTDAQIATGLTALYTSWRVIDDPDRYHSRAVTIVETEVGEAGSFGSSEGASQAGMTNKTWVSQQDGLVRDSHVEMHNVTVPITATFPNGLRFPRDSAGAPGEVINCRCFLEYS